MNILAFELVHSTKSAERLGKKHDRMRAILYIPRTTGSGASYAFVEWVAEINKDNLSANISQLKQLAKEANPEIEFETSIPVHWVKEQYS